ncbi:unnamed protein product, partial [Brassicogethes aeneus]
DFDYPLLIKLVQNNPHLYDKSLEDFKDDLVRSKTFRKIAKRLGVTEREAIQRWKNLRDKYGREKRKVIPSGAEPPIIPWPYLKEMSFLNKFIKQRHSNKSFVRSESPQPSPQSLIPSLQPFEFVYLSDNSSSSSPPPLQPRPQSPSIPLPQRQNGSPQLSPEPIQCTPNGRGKKRKRDEFDLLAAAQELANDLKLGRQEKTSNQLFGEYMGKRLDDFSPNRAKDIRKKIVLLLETD